MGGGLVGVGGLIVDADQLANLENEIEKICTDRYSFPPGEMFKWSPGKKDWYRENIVDLRRDNFLSEVLNVCARFDAKAVVAVCDIKKEASKF
jgi:hypothetical protein